MTRIVSNSAVKHQIAMTLLMAPSQPSHFLKKQGLGEEIPHIRIFCVSARALATIIQIRRQLMYSAYSNFARNGAAFSKASLKFLLVDGAMSHKVKHKDSSKFAERTLWRNALSPATTRNTGRKEHDGEI
ncbi:hypothetical protein E2C01_084171 [Portunus trituberculatus]|uniref:Uncharacterized protein n=1 Tax=Portunus trituberculatus TaxID=210409 RepID=A0A5B7J9Z5_PORTR|nr:hypothetical protein [Portunus trituberculatus]